MLARPALIGSLACIAFASGALLPWVPPLLDSARPQTAKAQTSPAPMPGTLPFAAPQFAAAPARPGDSGTVVAIGDSTLLLARTCLESQSIEVHPEAVESPADLLAEARRRAGTTATIFIQVGHSGGIVDGQIREVIDALGPSARIIWGTIRAPNAEWGGFSYEDRTNASIRNVVGRDGQGRVLDWAAMTQRHTEWTVDGVQPSEIGCRAYARKVVKLSGLPRGT